MRRILLFGSLVHPDAVASIPEASEAANRFQLGLLDGLLHAGVQTATAITLLPIAAVPRPRKVVVRRVAWRMDDRLDIIAPGFLNLPPVKPVWAHATLRRAGFRVSGGVEAVLGYNPQPGPGSAGLAVARRLAIPFVCIAADYAPAVRRHSPFRAAEQRWQTRIIQASDGMVVLSGHTARDLGSRQPWIKIDGGVSDDWGAGMAVGEVRPKTVLYAGTPAYVSGARLLLDAFARIEDPDMRLVFAGRGGLEVEVRAAAARDPRISLLGFMPRTEMQQALASATVLVNPRLSEEHENRHNFPSKILDYLASGRPVITTLAGDLDPAFSEVAIPLRDETPEALAALLQQVCALPESVLAAIGARGRGFVFDKRRWAQQAAEVYRFIETLVAARPR